MTKRRRNYWQTVFAVEVNVLDAFGRDVGRWQVSDVFLTKGEAVEARRLSLKVMAPRMVSKWIRIRAYVPRSE